MIFFKSRNLQHRNLLRDKLRAKMVIRATALFNLQRNNVARQVVRKCCPYYLTFRVTSEQSGALWHILGGVYFPVEINYYHAWLISKRLPVAKIKRDEDLELLFEWFSRLFFVYQVFLPFLNKNLQLP